MQKNVTNTFELKQLFAAEVLCRGGVKERRSLYRVAVGGIMGVWTGYTNHGGVECAVWFGGNNGSVDRLY